MRRSRRAKIIATLGPASSDADTIRALFDAGVDVFRLNFSHGTHADHAERVDILRRIEADTRRPIGVMLDLQGPKLRVGNFPGGHVDLEAGTPFRLELAEGDGDARHACLPHPEIFSALEAGSALLIDDGRIHLRVTEAGSDFAETEVVSGGELSDHKGVNVPGVALPISPITAKDREDLEYGLDLGVDWVALSFVQRPDDITEARNLIKGRASILAKLEKPAAIERLEEIVDLSDAVMVARGDLGVELPPEDVPILQKRIVRTCREAGKPVVVATQMLESMVRDPRPTRAEASDVATAIYEGADAVMLSAETAAGQHPIEAVAMMDRIVERVELDPNFRKIMDAEHPDPEPTSADAITAAARQGRRHPFGGGHRHLHDLGLDHPARGAGAATGAHPLPHPRPRHGPAPRTRLGHPRGAHVRCHRRGRDGGRRLLVRRRTRLRRARPTPRHHRRHALRHARAHQSPPRRLDRGLIPGKG